MIIGLILGIDLLLPPNLMRFKDTSHQILADDKSLLHVFQTADEKWRLTTNFQEIDPSYLKFLIRREDKRFWQHRGVDLLALTRAVFQMIHQGKIISGGSTLTMQTARLLEPRPRSYTSKLIEIIRAFQLERRYSKEEILAMYLTLAPFGGNIEGIKAASLAYFSHLPNHLSPAEAALLVALPQSPSKLQPIIFPLRAKKARDKILKCMLYNNILHQDEYNAALNEPLPLQFNKLPRSVPHLAWRLHKARPYQEIHYSTVNRGIQKAVEKVMNSFLSSLPSKANIAIMVLEHRENKVKAYIGSSNFFDESREGQIDFTCVYRSPGSTLKPFIYGLAFEEGLIKPDSLLLDQRLRFGVYSPGNFDKRYRGMVTAREALQLSLNIPAVSVLNQIGVLRFLGALKAGGLTPKFKDAITQPTLAVALGGLGLTLEHLVTAYAGLAREGILKPLHYTAYAKPEKGYAFLSKRSAEQLSQILKYEYEEANLAQPSSKISYKTGTSYGHRDVWALGYNKSFTVGIWIGNPDGSPMGKETGRSLAVPVMRKVFQVLPALQETISSSANRDQNLFNTNTKLHLLKDTQSRGKILSFQAMPRLLFPVEGTIIERDKTDAQIKILPLRVAGGLRPYTWMINGTLMQKLCWQQKYDWHPKEPGFYTVTVIDAEGKDARANIELR